MPMNIDSFAVNKRTTEERKTRKILRLLLARFSEPETVTDCRNDVE